MSRGEAGASHRLESCAVGGASARVCVMRRLAFLVCSLALSLSSACSSSESGPAAKPDSGDSGPPLLSDSGACGVTTQRYAITSGLHVPQGEKVDYISNPPCGGNHYGLWVVWGAHTIAIPPGNWVHNLEHGGVVFLYRCASRAACPDTAAKLEALAKSLPTDPLCVADGEGVKNRILVIPDPDLPAGVEVAAASWNNTLVARCFDEGAFRDFYLQHFGQGTEATCAQGFIEDGPGDAGPDGGDASSDAGTDGASDASDASGGG
jgi:hypothetical protein